MLRQYARTLHLGLVSYGQSYFPGTAAKRLSRNASVGKGAPSKRKLTAASKAVTCSSGKTTRKDFKRTIDSRRHVFRSKWPLSSASQKASFSRYSPLVRSCAALENSPFKSLTKSRSIAAL